ncbi:MAG: hypothetical protein ACRC3H_07295 [Lachnospiraceae bacterium]
MTEVLLDVKDKDEAVAVAEFLKHLNPEQKKGFMDFMQGARFMYELKLPTDEKTA